jgi:hypothetical protein
MEDRERNDLINYSRMGSRLADIQQRKYVTGNGEKCDVWGSPQLDVVWWEIRRGEKKGGAKSDAQGESPFSLWRNTGKYHVLLNFMFSPVEAAW